MTAASAHVLVEPRQDCHAVRASLAAMLAREHGITHLTLQVDHAPEKHADGGHPAGANEGGEGGEDGVTEHGDHTPLHPHCEDSHGPAYRPAQSEGSVT